MDPVSAEPPYLLAAQAASVVRRLNRQVREGEPDSTADLDRTLGALRRLADDLARARAAGLLMAQELRASQRLLGGMAAPLDG
ncbi:hypothetical protein [Amycolatopsis sp. cmx-11-12]|uniref:hypothetical protein n=1 Tax=Amycolatopsis sp. cmx-11-12 TaxID=2785795 RepID=UPI0039170D8A